MKSQNGCSDRLSYVVFLVSMLISQVSSQLIGLRFNTARSNQELRICALKKSFYSGNQDNNVPYELISLLNEDGCEPIHPPFPPYSTPNQSSLYLHTARPNCQFSTIAKNLQVYSPGLVLVGSDGPINANASVVNLTASYVFFPEFLAQKLDAYISQQPPSSNFTVTMYSELNRFDLSLIIIWLVAVITVFFGALWTKYEFVKSLNPEKKKNGTREQSSDGEYQIQVDQTVGDDLTNEIADQQVDRDNVVIENQVAAKSKKESDKNQPVTIQIGLVSILILLVFVVGMLLLLYFFYNVMIYFIFVIFIFGASTAFYRIGSLVYENTQLLSCKLPKCKSLPYFRDHDIEIRKILLFAVSLTLSIIWFVYRHEKWAWILQNMMALALATNALSLYRLGTYKTAAIILTLFFLYDVFMVFVTPTFTKGASIMEAVAFGGRDNEASQGQDWSNLQFGPHKDTFNRLPVVIIIPHLSPFRRLCEYYYDFSFSLLGLGDILVPGLSVNYAIIYDKAVSMQTGRRSYIYFIVNMIAYLIGLFLAFIGLLFMNSAQPALFYLCPMLITSSLVTAALRKEFKVFWSGEAIGEIIKSKSQRLSASKNSNVITASQPATNNDQHVISINEANNDQ